MGLDPGLGFLHADQGSRDSLPCDLMEPLRPKVDSYVLVMLSKRKFRKADFFETREGICRLMPPLTHELAGTATRWAKELGPVTECVAAQLFGSRPAPKRAVKNGAAISEILPTPLTESNRRAGREILRALRER